VAHAREPLLPRMHSSFSDSLLDRGKDEAHVARVRRLRQVRVDAEARAVRLREAHRMYLAALLTSAPPLYSGKKLASG